MLLCVVIVTGAFTAQAQVPTLQDVTTQGASTDKTITLHNQLVLNGLERGIQFNTNGNMRWLIRNEFEETGNNTGSNFALHSYADDGTRIGANVYINRATSRVGINITTPRTDLHVAGDITSRVLGLTHNYSDIGFLGHGPSITTYWNAIPDAFTITTNRDIAIGGWAKSTTAWRGAAIFINSDNGNVMINKTSQTNASYKLDVAGNVRADKVVVNSNGADFVFAPGYNLPSLVEVERFITKNRHLPGIVPAAEMQQNGLDVGDQQTKLLQKIEELTLYVIDLNKKVAEQQTVIQQQAKEIQRIGERKSR